MRTIVFTVFACALLSACGVYRPTPAERVHIVDSPVDTYKCRHLGKVGGPFATAPNFDPPLEAMVKRTAALGGNTLYLVSVHKRQIIGITWQIAIADEWKPGGVGYALVSSY